MAQAHDAVFERLRMRIRKLMNDISDNVTTGSCKNFPEYTNKTGIIEGLALAERELLDLDDELLHED